MTGRERILAMLNHQEADRVPIHDSPWATTIERWKREGLPEDVSVEDYFGFEFGGVGADTSLRLPKETVEETEEYTVVKNENGALVRNWKSATSTPEMIDFTITDQKAWEENRPRMAMSRDRIDFEGSLETLHRERGKGRFVTLSFPIGYDKTQGICGSESLLMAMGMEPEWTRDMFSTGTELTLQCMEEMLGAGIDVDAVWFFDDMGYRNTSLFSPRMYREMLLPEHKRACDFCHQRKLPVILHSCGCVKGLVPDLIEAGFDCLQPLEVKAGMDVVELKKAYGERLAFMGGIDVRRMSMEDPKEIEHEIAEKIPIAMEGGGYIYHSDHSVPDDVSFERFQYVLELVKKYGTY